MLLQLVMALVLSSITVLIHAMGTEVLVVRRARSLPIEDRNRFSSTTLVAVVCVLLLLHLLEVGVWACAYWLFGLLPDLETSFYFSLSSYTTVGYGDVVLPISKRLLGPFEGALGILMLGWSTGIIVAALQRLQTYRMHREKASRDGPV